ncbi:unnamed protein product [Ixodes pacificus]
MPGFSAQTTLLKPQYRRCLVIHPVAEFKTLSGRPIPNETFLTPPFQRPLSPDKHDGGTSCVMDTPDAATLPADMASLKLCASRRVERAPTVSDMFVAYPTIKGYVSLKNEVSGSWFLGTVFRVFSEHAWNTHLNKMMRRVAEEVLKRESDVGGRQTINNEERGWRKKLYFNPGLALEQAAP